MTGTTIIVMKVPMSNPIEATIPKGLIRSSPTAQFLYQHTYQALNSETYQEFLEDHLLPKYYKKSQHIYLIHDNASYPKKPETYKWFRKHRKYLEVYNLPPNSPERNAEERLWHYTRMCATHNRYYNTKEELCANLFATFENMQ